MTPEAKKRCEDHIEDAIEKWALGYDENTSFRVLGAELFQAGYNDPDNQGILEECEKLLYDVKVVCDDYSLFKTLKDVDNMIQKLKAARGG